MAWIKVDDGFPDHPKVLVLSLAAQGLWLAGLCYCNRLMTNGMLPSAFLRRMGDQAAWDAAEELVSVGLWEERGDGWEYHDYLDYQRSRNDIVGLSEKRAAAGRNGGTAQPKQTKSKPEAKAKQTQANRKQNRIEENRTEEKREDILLEGFAYFWDAYPVKKAKPAAMAAWKKRKFNDEQVRMVLTALDRQKLQWSDPKYIPHPATWLNQERWADEVATTGGRKRGVNPFLDLLQEEDIEQGGHDAASGDSAFPVPTDGNW